jgi:hypothetical protein
MFISDIAGGTAIKRARSSLAHQVPTSAATTTLETMLDDGVRPA